MIEVEELKTLKTILINRVTEQLGDPNLNASRLINTLADLTVHDASEPDIGWEKAKYHATRLAVELGNAKNDADKDRRYINRIWKDMIEAFEVIEPSIENDAQKAGLRKILKPKKTDPKTGRVEFYLDVQEVEDREGYPVENSSNTKRDLVIDYKLVKKPKLTMAGRIFSQISMKTRGILLRFIPLTLFLPLYIWFLNILESEESTINEDFFMLAFCLIIFIYIFRSYYRVENTGTAIAPSWFGRLSAPGNIIIEKRYTGDKDDRGFPKYKLVLAKYEAVCPICGENVDLDWGNKVHSGRLIGRCLNNPVEHIYSFDHVTRKGIPLRKDIYLGQVD